MIVCVTVVHARVGEHFPATFPITTETSNSCRSKCFYESLPVRSIRDPSEGICKAAGNVLFKEIGNVLCKEIGDVLCKEIGEVLTKPLANIFSGVFKPVAELFADI